MPEATAQLTKPVDGQPIRIDDSLNKIRQSVGANADKAIGNKGTIHNPVPAIEMGIPVHVPSGKTVNTNDYKDIDVPQTHKSNNFLDNLGHLPGPNLYDDKGASARVSDVRELTQATEERNLAAMNARNNPNSGKGVLGNLVDWFYDEDKKAA